MRRCVACVPQTVLVAALALSLAACGGSSKSGIDLAEPEDVEDAADVPGDNPVDVPGDGTDTLPDDVNPGDVPVDTTPEVDVVNTCLKDKDCENVDLGAGDACRQKKVCQKPANVCVFTWETGCCREAVILEQGFETGMDGWVVADPNTKDVVTWSVTDHRKARGTKSLYFGDPTCFTYYNGALDGECQPVDPTGKDAGVVRASITSPSFFLPPLDLGKTAFYVSFFAWIDSEPLFSGVADQPDQFKVLAILNPGSSETIEQEPVFTSVQIEKTTDGKFLHVVGDLSKWANQTIALRLFFDSLDEGRNHYEGVYVDDFKVSTGCVDKAHPPCSAEAPCTADGVECTDDACQIFANNLESGVCAFPEIPSCVEPECTPANVATKCPTTDECQRASCPAGVCVFETLPPEQCCKKTTLLSAGFESGLDGFTVWAYQDNPTIRWQVSPQRASAGTHSLYFGNLATQTFAGDSYVFGEATSAPIDVPATGYAFLSFSLYLSTEFDDLVGDYYNPLGRDFFETIVVTDLGGAQEKATTVWSSHNVLGTTDKAFVPVGVDLTAYAGKQVWLRFRFDPSDTELNAYEGAYVDDVSIVNDPCKHFDCRGLYDCFIDGVCRTGSCTDNVCDVEKTGAEGCCSVQQDCDDLDPCTTDGCIQNLCFHDPFEMPGCCIPRTLTEYHFDVRTDLDGFEVVDQSVPGPGGVVATWSLSDAKAKSPTRSMHFGNDSNYDNGGISKGTATTPAVAIPEVGLFALSFELYLAVEPNSERDMFWVEVVEGGTATKVFDKAEVSGESYDTWYAVPAIDLTAWKGKLIRVRFNFDSTDALQNAGLGVFVDDVMLRKTCP